MNDNNGEKVNGKKNRILVIAIFCCIVYLNPCYGKQLDYTDKFVINSVTHIRDGVEETIYADYQKSGDDLLLISDGITYYYNNNGELYKTILENYSDNLYVEDYYYRQCDEYKDNKVVKTTINDNNWGYDKEVIINYEYDNDGNILSKTLLTDTYIKIYLYKDGMLQSIEYIEEDEYEGDTRVYYELNYDIIGAQYMGTVDKDSLEITIPYEEDNDDYMDNNLYEDYYNYFTEDGKVIKKEEYEDGSLSVTEYTYYPNGTLSRTTISNVFDDNNIPQLVTTYDYDSEGYTTNMMIKDSSGETEIYTYKYIPYADAIGIIE